ncbi:MAG: molybdopterin oxidoreductase family protein [Defluviicoccus sp.]|nr:molybdopterin oxidoreductase family protein [Defluviicoccus sp.]MDE0382595.1 molybdopterin oxidoreductase family protein [Defluviicoccus sp.]
MPLDAAPEIVPSTCPHDCPSACALDVERLDAHTIGRVHGAKSNPYTAGVVCAKVARYAERVHHPARLTRPLRRVGARGEGIGAFAPIGWDEALDEVADRLKATAREWGSEAVWPYFYAGTMGLVQRDGIDRLRHAMRYARQHSTFCVALADAGWRAGVGVKYGTDSREIQDADLIVVWGGNPVNTQVNVMTHVARARKQRGAKLVVVDPYRTGTAEQADMHLALRPGTDGALACAVMHVLFRDGWADRAFMQRYADCPGALEDHLQTRGPGWAARITGLSVDEIEAFAALYGRTDRAYMRVGYGFTRSRNGAANMHAVTSIPTVAGKWRHPGGGALYSNAELFPVDFTLIRGLDAMDKSTRVLDQARIGPVLAGDPRDGTDRHPVKAMFIQNTNPMMVAPETRKVREGFLREDLFVCVHEQFMTETAAMADIVLPATTFLEHDDIYLAGGHTYLQIARRVIEPLGACRSNHEVLCGLAERLGADHPGFRMTAWEIVDATLRASGLGDAGTAAEGRWIDCAKPSAEMRFLGGFGHADGRFRFRPDWSAVGRDAERMPALPDHLAIVDEADDEHPFRLVTAPARNYLNSSFTETPTSQKREKRPTIKLHPADLAAAGIGDGDRVQVGNRRASIVVHAEAFDGLQRGVAVIESLWPNAAFEEGLGVNALVSADPGPPYGGAVYHDTAIWVRPA